MKNFTKTKNYIIKKSKNLNACESELKKVINSKNFDELIEVIRINAQWVINHKLLKNTSSVKYFGVSIMNLLNSGNRNSGYCNSGDSNSGDRNSGDNNSGYRNSGYNNSGNRNSGDSNSGYNNSGDNNSGYNNSGNSNSGYCNSGNRNSGYNNSGYNNSGYCNSGYCNSGDSNSGKRNSGYNNSGDNNSGYNNSGNSNSGDCNSGNRNSGYFNTTNPKILIIFNKPCEFDIWKKAKKPDFIYKIYLAEWIEFGIMSEKEKIKNPKSEITNGYLKKHSYKEAWGNAFKKATPEDIDLLKNLPNFDKKIFYKITGINIK